MRCENFPLTDTMLQELPSGKGTYILLFESTNETTVAIGKLGSHIFHPGYYAYTGSAFGPGGLGARVGHHLAKKKKYHWHIDFLRARIDPYEIWLTCYPEKLECSWFHILSSLEGGNVPCNGFGSTDCNCLSHLVHFGKRPSLVAFQNRQRDDNDLVFITRYPVSEPG